MSRRLFTRPLWRDPLIWLWVLGLPISFQVTYVWEERVGTGVDSGQAWATQIAAVWAVFTLAVLLIAGVRKYLTR